MKLTDGEKLVLIMLCDLHKKLGLDEEIDPNFVKSAILSDNLWGINWKFSGIPFEREETPKDVLEVLDILDMWSLIERSVELLPEKEKAVLEKRAAPFGKNVKFGGFDGNHETSYLGIAEFLIRDLERFQEFKDRDLNSHMPTIGMYRRMIKVFKPIKSELDTSNYHLNAEQLITILLEQIHSDNRK